MHSKYVLQEQGPESQSVRTRTGELPIPNIWSSNAVEASVVVLVENEWIQHVTRNEKCKPTITA